MSFRLLSNLTLSCAALSLLCQCSKETASRPVEEKSLATVAGKPITESDLVREAKRRQAGRLSVPEPEVLLKEMAERLALVERARQAGIENDPDTRHRIESLLIATLREKDLDAALAKVEVSDKELEAAWQTRSGEFARKGIERFSILFQAAGAKQSKESRAESRARLEAGIALADANPAPGGRGPAAAGFGSVAADYSDDQVSRYRGGDIGWLESGAGQSRWPASVIEAGRALEKGARSGILETDDGFYVIMKTDSRPGGVRPFEEVSERLRQGLLREKRLAIEERFVADAVKQAKVEMDSAAASKVTLPVSERPAARSDKPPGFPGISSPAATR